MTNTVNTVGLYVRDQDEALAFYVGMLGFEVHTDVRNGSYRWLTVRSPGQDGFQLGLFVPGPPHTTRPPRRHCSSWWRKAQCLRWCWPSMTAGHAIRNGWHGASSSPRSRSNAMAPSMPDSVTRPAMAGR